MVLKIQRPPNMPLADADGGRERQAKKQKVDHNDHNGAAPAGDQAADADGGAAASDAVHHGAPPPLPSPMEAHHHPHQQHHDHPPPHPPHSNNLCCAGCGVAESASSGPLLLFEDPEEDNTANEEDDKKPDEEKRYCAGCMTGKKVRVFWPVDSQWYIADVQRYDATTGEHLLRYPDGDTEWVRIGEDHTTNSQYKEYFRNHHSHAQHGDQHGPQGEGGLTRLPSLGGNGAMSFALSAMSQSFGIPAAPTEDEKTMRLKPPSQQQRLFQQLNLDRTASSMSSFGMYTGNNSGGGGGGPMNTRQPSFGGHPPPPPPHNGNSNGNNGGGRAPPFQILSPNFTHSFSSKIGTVPSMDFGPPPAHPSGKASESGGGGGHPPHMPYGPPPPHHHHHQYHQHQHHHPQQREEGSIPTSHSGSSPGTRDGVPGAVSHGSHPPSWPPPHQSSSSQDPYPNSNYYEGGHPPPMGYGYPPPPPPPPGPDPSSYDSKHPPKTSSSTTPTTPSSKKSSSKNSNNNKDSLKSRKALAKAWSKAEDEHLLDLVLQMKHPLKWSIIAQSMSDFSAGSDTPLRTGKQCRERYVNHLNPRLKHTEFTPLEDATIWRLYATIGTQWAKMSKVIPGRTDNNLKNRFHNLKRQLQREEDGRLRAPEPENYEECVYANKVREIPAYLRTRIEDMWNQPRHIGAIAAGSVQESREDDDTKDEAKSQDEQSSSKEGGGTDAPSSSATTSEPVSPGAAAAAASVAASEDQRLRKFGPFEPVTEPTQCGRCGLFLPSVQCGEELCTKTKWCRVCTKVSMHLGGNVLRECLNLRKSRDKEIAVGVEKMMMG